MKPPKGLNDSCHTGNKTFDKLAGTNACEIVQGNSTTNVLYSSYIRAHTDCLNPVNETVPEGELRKFDLNQFKRFGEFPWLIQNWFASNKTKKCILYCVRHYNKGKDRPVVHGWILTDIHPTYRVLVKGYGDPKVIDEVSLFLEGDRSCLYVDQIYKKEERNQVIGRFGYDKEVLEIALNLFDAKYGV